MVFWSCHGFHAASGHQHSGGRHVANSLPLLRRKPQETKGKNTGKKDIKKQRTWEQDQQISGPDWTQTLGFSKFKPLDQSWNCSVVAFDSCQPGLAGLIIHAAHHPEDSRNLVGDWILDIAVPICALSLWPWYMLQAAEDYPHPERHQGSGVERPLALGIQLSVWTGKIMNSCRKGIPNIQLMIRLAFELHELSR